MVAVIIGNKNKFLALVGAYCWIVSEDEGGHGLTSLLVLTVEEGREKLEELYILNEIEWEELGILHQTMVNRGVAPNWAALVERISSLDITGEREASGVRFQLHEVTDFPLICGNIVDSCGTALTRLFCTFPHALAEVFRLVARQNLNPYEGVKLLQDMLRLGLSISNADLQARFKRLPESVQKSCMRDMSMLNLEPDEFHRAIFRET